MSLKYKYILFIGIIHVVMVVLIYQLLEEKKWLFLATEILILISLALSYQLYKSFIRPIQMMQSGIDAIADGDFSIKYAENASSEINNLISIYNDMIQQLRDERTLMSSQSYFLQNLIEVTPLGIVIMDYDGLISNINPAARNLLEIDHQWHDKQLSDFPSDLIGKILALDINSPTLIETNGLEKYKVQINEVVHQGFKRKFILIDDLSTEMLTTQKEAFGKIIRMMAHEVNNSMGAVNSIIDTVVEYGFENQEDQLLKDSLVLAKERNLGLSQFMANYASILRLPSPKLVNMDLALLLKRSGQLFLPRANELNIKITFDLPKIDVPIKGDKLLLEQAVSNMIKNAIESIDFDGEIIISCTEFPVSFSITDNGAGISDEAANKLFTPFYSTKPAGQGVGLMLIREILNSHKASFSLKTDKRNGRTSFTVNF